MKTAEIDELFAKYPHPVAWSMMRGVDYYCVGAIACREAFKSIIMATADFPGVWEIADAIQTLNPRVSVADALAFAWKIAELNDAGDIREALGLLRTALHGGEEE